MARRSRTPPPTHRWFQVRARMRCAMGDHDVYGGEWMRTRLGDFRQLHSCEVCLEKVGIHRPSRPFTFTRRGAPDVRSRQSGRDE